MPRRMRTQAIVLNRAEAGESHRLVTLLSRDLGKLRVFAPGARRSKRRFAGCLELFARIEASLVERPAGRLPQLEEARLLDPHEAIKSDLVCIGHAGYLAELTAAMLGEGDQAIEMYELLEGALEALDRGPLDSFGIRCFELAVLHHAGLAPHLSSCVHCGAESTGSWKFDFEQGGVLCDRCESPSVTPARPLGRAAWLLIRAIEAGRPPDRTDPEDMATVRDLLARIIDQHVGRPLKARGFLYQIAKKPN